MRVCPPVLVSGYRRRHGYDEAGVSMQPGEGADRLRLATISKRLVAAFREEPRV